MGEVKVAEAVKKVRSQSRLSWLQIFATALAAITMAVVSSQITSVFNSVLAVGLISIISALIGEFWRLTLAVGAETTKQIYDIEPSEVDGEGASEGEGAPQGSDAVDATTESENAPRPYGASTLIDKALVNEVAAVIAEEYGGLAATPGRGEDATEVLVPVTGAAEDEASAPSSSDGLLAAKKRGKWATFWYVVSHSQALQMSLLFAVIGLITVGVSYSVAKAQGGDIHITNVEQQLTEEQKQQILDAAIEAAKEQQQQPSENTPTQPETPTTNEPTFDEQAFTDALSQLTDRNAQLQQELSDITAQLQAQTQRGDTLESRLNELEQQLAELQAREQQTPTG